MNMRTEFSLTPEASQMAQLQNIFDRMPAYIRQTNARDNLGDLIYATGFYTLEEINHFLQWGAPSVCFGKFSLARNMQSLYLYMHKASVSSLMTKNSLADLISRIALSLDENFMSLDHNREHLMREQANVIMNALSWEQDSFTGLRYLWPVQQITVEIDCRIVFAVCLVILASIFENAPDVLPNLSWRMLINTITTDFSRIFYFSELPVRTMCQQIPQYIIESKKDFSDVRLDSEKGNTIDNRNAPAGAIDTIQSQRVLLLPAPVEEKPSVLSGDIRDILIAVKEGPKRSKEIASFLNQSGRHVKEQGLEPAIKAGLVQPLYKAPKHPRQAYSLTETGRKALETSSE